MGFIHARYHPGKNCITRHFETIILKKIVSYYKNYLDKKKNIYIFQLFKHYELRLTNNVTL